MAVKKRDGIVYSTNPDFKYDEEKKDEATTLPKGQQTLYVWVDSRNRSGKTVTLIKGFIGRTGDLEDLATSLRKYCGTGGSVKNGEIIIQGDFRNKIISWLNTQGYNTKKAGG
ncbi:MAG TPA: translation initiation factor [Bacteroidales bacterium]|jgi:translation initiation factor 1|nr:translation initiation factor [Bacteroidales bacterium]